jgi:hypothetical protein
MYEVPQDFKCGVARPIHGWVCYKLVSKITKSGYTKYQALIWVARGVTKWYQRYVSVKIVFLTTLLDQYQSDMWGPCVTILYDESCTTWTPKRLRGSRIRRSSVIKLYVEEIYESRSP